jgi:hypothetical protein
VRRLRVTSLRRFFDGETIALPHFYTDQVRKDLGFLWDSLPEGALAHDQNAYLRAQPTTSRPSAAIRA